MSIAKLTFTVTITLPQIKIRPQVPLGKMFISCRKTSEMIPNYILNLKSQIPHLFGRRNRTVRGIIWETEQVTLFGKMQGHQGRESA